MRRRGFGCGGRDRRRGFAQARQGGPDQPALEGVTRGDGLGDDGFLDRGGANNLISPINGTSQNCWGMATSGYLVDVAKVTMAEMEGWKGKYPDAFARAYDPAAGLRFDAWVIKEGEEA